MTPIVLIHGGHLDSRCWEQLVPHLEGPVLAVDLPGRGAHPAPLDSVVVGDCAVSVRDDIDAAGFDSVVLVGHSLAGCSMPATAALLGERVRGMVFVACTVPESGRSAFDTLDADIQALIRATGEPSDSGPMAPALARAIFGDDIDDEQFAWCYERLVPDAPRLSREPVDLSPLRTPVPRTWVRTLRDLIVPPAKQLRFANNVGDCPVVDIDAGHMCMVSQPVVLADILNGFAT